MTVKLHKSTVPITTGVSVDGITREIMSKFDIFDPNTDFHPWMSPELPDTWKIGLVVGASGTGKSTLLPSLGTIKTPVWRPMAPIAEHFESVDDAIDRLGAVGLNSVPTWGKPYHVLSTGEKFRADLARSLHSGAVIDEYTSTVSRTVAKSASRSMRKWVDRNPVENIVVATCHYDVVEWLQPDWIIDTDAGEFRVGKEVHDEQWWFKFTKYEEGAILCRS